MLTIAHARKRFGAVQALDGCSFTVARGRMLGFLGPNGAGKTTAMRAIFGLVELDEGDLSWDGRRVRLLSSCLRSVLRCMWTAPQGALGSPLRDQHQHRGDLLPLSTTQVAYLRAASSRLSPPGKLSARVCACFHLR